MSHNIAVIVGSLRKESLNRKIAMVLKEVASKNLNLNFVEIGSLPLYNQDLDENPPKEWVEFRNKIKPADGLLFVTPEYNRSIPGVLKNAIDVGSRPYGSSVWGGKPAGVVSASPSLQGGVCSNQHLRQTFVFLDIHPMQQPEAYIGQADKLFDDKGQIKDDTKAFLKKFIDSFAKWVEKINTH